VLFSTHGCKAITAEMIVIRIVCGEAWSSDMAGLLLHTLPPGRYQGSFRVDEVVPTTLDDVSGPPVDMKNRA